MYDLKFADATLTTWALIRQTWLIMHRAVERRLAKVGMTPEQVAVLWICRDYHGISSVAEISRFMSLQSQTITGLLNRMEEEGLVTRVPKRKGRPFTEVKLTKKGEEACRVGIAVIRILVSETKLVVSAEERQLFHQLLGKMRHQLVNNMNLELTIPPDLPMAEPIPIKW
jgi:DNA-binding MarR family transcriptional regulator